VEYNQKLKNTVKMVCITIQPEPKEYSKNGMYDRSVKLQQSFMCIMGTLGIGEGSGNLQTYYLLSSIIRLAVL
jgi:hypothetical protein